MVFHSVTYRYSYALYEYLALPIVINSNTSYPKQYTIGILRKKNEQMFYKYGIPIVHLRNITEYEIGIQTVPIRSTLKKYKQLVVDIVSSRNS